MKQLTIKITKRAKQGGVGMRKDELIEILSDVEHTRWSGWQAYLHGKCIKNEDGSLTIPAGYAKNLKRLIKTPYSELTETEKESDRDEAKKTLDVFDSWLKNHNRGYGLSYFKDEGR